MSSVEATRPKSVASNTQASAKGISRPLFMALMMYRIAIGALFASDAASDRTSLISDADAIWPQLRIWVDANADGVVTIEAGLGWACDLDKDFKGVEMIRHPVEDFARATVTLEDETGREVIVEASTSWSYVGPGLRIDLALLGPEYAMEFSSLNPSLKVFLSRAITGGQGEDLVEKQNAEQGQMPIVEDEAGTYGYIGENRHMVDCFRHGSTPIETFADGVEVTKMVMGLYKSAETGQTVRFPDESLETYVPVPARQEADA